MDAAAFLFSVIYKVKECEEEGMTQLPEGFKKRMRELLGEEYEAFAASYEKERVQGLRFNSLKTAKGREEGWETGLGADMADFVHEREGLTLKHIPWVKEGYYYGSGSRPGKHPFHEAGLYYIQEPSAMAVAELLDPVPGELVLDLCAAPGGKSSHIASRLKGRGLLVSNEIHPTRAKILSQNMERMGAVNVVVTNEDPRRLSGRFEEFFHKIIVDAPCSGEGMFRKDEEARNEWSEEHVRMCADRQTEILDRAARMLRPGGRLVYSTCTFAPEENEGTILTFLMEHKDFHLEKVPAYEGFLEGRPDWASYKRQLPCSTEEIRDFHLERTLRIMPHRLEGEGHFIAVLRKKEGDVREQKRKEPAYLDKKKEKECMKSLEQFLSDTLQSPENYRKRKEYVMFGDQLYLLPAQMPDMKGLKVLRPGLHMGTLLKNRFEPSHALALALLPGEAKGSYEMPADSEAVIRYLKGEALPCEPERLHGKEKGWVLVCVDGISLGWCKLAGGILKNHYPKGLRWKG